jgi:hypothetical protein
MMDLDHVYTNIDASVGIVKRHIGQTINLYGYIAPSWALLWTPDILNIPLEEDHPRNIWAEFG